MKSVDLPHLFRQHRDFIKIMIKYKDFKQYWIQPDQSFFPNPNKSQSVPWEGETRSLNCTSPHPKTPNRSREEDSIGVLTVPSNLFKKETGKAEWRTG